MPINLEFKTRIPSLKYYQSKLAEINAEFVSVLKQKDIYYKSKGRLLKLRIENGIESVILYDRNEKTRNRWSDYHILHISGGNTEKFLDMLFTKDVTVEKRRLLFKYDNTRIHLDSVNKLGTFLELETLVINGKKEAKKRFDTIIELLGLNPGAGIRKSYRDLIKKAG